MATLDSVMTKLRNLLASLNNKTGRSDATYNAAINALPSKKTSDNVTVSGATVTTPSGIYFSQVQKSVSYGELPTPNISLNSSTGVVTATAAMENGTEGYIDIYQSSEKTYTLPSGSLSVSGKTVTASQGYFTGATSKSVADGEYSASVSLTSGSGSVSATGTNVSLTEASSKPSSGYYITAQGSGSVSATGTATVGTAGYIATGSNSSSASSKTSNTATKYYTLPSGACTVAGGGLSVTNNYSGTPTVDITLDGQTTSGAAITTTKPSSGYYLTLGASSSALSGTTKVTRAAVTDTHTAGYISAKSATTVISSTTASPTVTVNKGTKTEYVTLPTGGCTVAGGALSGGSAVTPTVTLSNGSDTNMSNITAGAKDTTNYPYYFKVSGASSAGSSTVSRAAVTDTHTAGYIPAKSTATAISADSKTVTVNAGSGSTYVGLKAGGCTVSGGGLTSGAGSVSASGTNVTLTQVSSKPSSGSYITVTGSGSVSRAAITDTHTAGYIPAKSATTVSSATSKSSNTATKYYTLPTKTASNVTVSGNTVTIPAGYYPSQVQKTVESTASIQTGVVTFDTDGLYGFTPDNVRVFYTAYDANGLSAKQVNKSNGEMFSIADVVIGSAIFVHTDTCSSPGSDYSAVNYTNGYEHYITAVDTDYIYFSEDT